MADSGIPEHARVVVIGGGIIGCSVAYNLAEMGCADVVLLERDQLTSGTTWHAAGLMTTYGSGSETSLSIRKHSHGTVRTAGAGDRPAHRLQRRADSSRWRLIRTAWRSTAA